MTTKVWSGGAAGIAQVETITLGGTWVTSETMTVTIGGSDLVLTVGAVTTTTGLASALAAAVNATTKTDGVIGTETRNVGGQQIPEFQEITASASGSTVVLEANDLGVPFTVSVSETSTSGTISTATTVSATGPNFYSNAQNWLDGSLPTNADKIVFQGNSVDCLYGLDQSATTNVTLQIEASYTGRIGLKPYNDGGYDEYRSRHLALMFSSAERAIVIGEGPGSGSGRINLDVASSNPKVLVILTASPDSNQKGAVDFKGGGASFDVSIRRGIVSLASDARHTATIRELEVSYEVQQETDATVYAGDGATIAEVTKLGGSVILLNTPSTLTITTVTNQAGYLEINGAASCTTMILNGGETRWHSVGTLATLKLSGAAILDVSRDLRAKTLTNVVERYSDASRILDPFQTITNLRIDNNQVSDLGNLSLGTDFRITRAATA